MKADKRKELALYLQEKIHKHHLPGFYFDEGDVLEYINNFFKVEDLIKQREEINEQIKKIEGER